METLDLHGVRYHRVELMVENFILMHDMPIRIITGNSPDMKKIVLKVVARHEFKSSEENHWNLGSLIIWDG